MICKYCATKCPIMYLVRFLFFFLKTFFPLLSLCKRTAELVDTNRQTKNGMSATREDHMSGQLLQSIQSEKEKQKIAGREWGFVLKTQSHMHA